MNALLLRILCHNPLTRAALRCRRAGPGGPVLTAYPDSPKPVWSAFTADVASRAETSTEIVVWLSAV